MHYSRTEYTRFSSNECCDVGLSELEAMSVRAGPRLLAGDGEPRSYQLAGRVSTDKRAYRTTEIFQTPQKFSYRHRLPAKGYPEDALRRQTPILSGPKENAR